MEQSELLRHLCTSLDRLGIRYLITGSHATIAFGEPRFTNDIDIVIALDAEHLNQFADCFPESDFFFSHQAARDAIRDRTMFNIIHPASGLKIDVIIPQNLKYDRERFDRGRRIQLAPDFAATFAAPEDVIVKKLEFYKLGESDKHLRDIAGVLRISGEHVDRALIAQLAEQRGVSEIWQLALNRANAR